MTRVVVWIGAAVLLIAIAGAAIWTRGHGSKTAQVPETQQSAWNVVQHPPGDRIRAKLAVMREFGSWHLMCREQPQQTPRLGAGQNFRMFAGNPNAPANTCHVYTMMANAKDPRQTLILDFRYTRNNNALRIIALHTLLSRLSEVALPPHPLAKVDRATNKLILEHTPTVLDVRLQVGRQTLALAARGCRVGHCLAALTADPALTDGLGANPILVVRLPPLSKGQAVRIVRLPGQGLAPALSALRQLTPA